MANHADLDPQTNEAITSALENNWAKALELNEELLKKYPDDIETMNRLARALYETGDLNEAKKIYQKVLRLDPYNQIAEKNLKRLSSLKGWKAKPAGNGEQSTIIAHIKGDIFLEEPGKTVVSDLVDLALAGVLASLRTGDEVSLTPHRNDVTIVAADGKRIGQIENEIAKIVSKNMRAGCKYSAFIKSVVIKEANNKSEKSKVQIFIRETHRSSKVTSPPFPTNQSTFTPFVREEALGLLAHQAPLPTEADDSIEEIEVSELQERDQSLEELAEKERQEDDALEED